MLTSQNSSIVSIYNYFITDYLTFLNTLPLKNQLLEIKDFKILVLDYCGMTAKLYNMFNDCDIYIVEDPNENVLEICKKYDVVYILVYQLQTLAVDYPSIKIICYRNKILETFVIRE